VGDSKSFEALGHHLGVLDLPIGRKKVLKRGANL
jgi:hypothetical protein